MGKQWLAVIDENNLIVAHIQTKKKRALKILFLESFREKDFLEIKEWLHINKIPYKYLRFAVSGLGLVTETIALPHENSTELEKAVSKHIEQFFAGNISDYIIDYRILKKYRDRDQDMLTVLIVAFPRQKMERIWSLCQYLGFEPEVIDLSADCITRLYSELSEPEGPELAVIVLERNRVEIFILQNGVLLSYSNLETDLQNLTETNLLIPEPLTGKSEEFVLEELYIPGERFHLYDIPVSILGDNKLYLLKSAISNMLSYYSKNNPGRNIGKIYLTGEYATLPNLAQIIQNNTGVETLAGFPLGWKPRFTASTKLSSEWQKYGCLYGLALREDRIE